MKKPGTGYSCYAPALPGCIAAGDDLPQTKALKEEAIEVHLAGMRDDGEPIPPPSTEAAYVEVSA